MTPGQRAAYFLSGEPFGTPHGIDAPEADMDKNSLLARQKSLQHALAEALAALPPHSITPAQFQRVEDLEERLREIEGQLAALSASEEG